MTSSIPKQTTTFETLFGKDKNGKEKTWRIFVEKHEDMAVIITQYGYNKMTESRVQVNAGKNIGKRNETSPFEQAVDEARSKWRKKQDIEKYETRTATQLRVDEPQEDLSRETEPVLPMLAHDYKKHSKKVAFPCFVQPKLDGYRMVFNTTTKQITTRQGKDFSIVREAGTLYEELMSLPSGYILDGELFNPELSFEFLGILRKKKIEGKDAAKKTGILRSIQYHVYDVCDTRLAFVERTQLLSRLLLSEHYTMVKNVETMLVQNEDEIKAQHAIFTTAGYEGTMVRKADGLYKIKNRSTDLLKYKDFMDEEFEIVDFTFEQDTTGKEQFLVVWIVNVCTEGGAVLCNVRPKGTEEERQELFKQCQADFSRFRGKKLWTKFFEYTAMGSLRFPTTKTESYETYIRDELV
jgi:DNA ligase-1